MSLSRLTDGIFESVESQVSYYINNFDNDLQRIKKLQTDLSVDDDLNQLANTYEQMDNFDRSMAFQRIRQQLDFVRNSSIYIESVRIIIPSLYWSINSFDDPVGSYSEISADEINRLKQLPIDSDSHIIYSDNRLFILAVFPSFIENKKDPVYMIEVDLSQDAIKKAIMQLTSYPNSGFILEKPSQKFIIESAGNDKFVSQLHNVINSRLEKIKSDKFIEEIGGHRYLMIYKTSKYTNMTLSVYLPEGDLLKSLSNLELRYWIFFLLDFIIIIAYAFYLYRLIRKPLVKIIDSFKNIENGDFSLKIEYSYDDELGYLYRRFNDMVNNLKTLIDQVYNQKILTQKAELKQLQSQINPHFLYNSYFLLHRIIKREDYDNAVRFSKEMGTYFKFITRSNSDFVSLESEIEHARIYMQIQSMRFEGRISTVFGNVPEEISDIQVPRLILQPIIENAFEHGLEDKQDNGLLIVDFVKQEENILITVEDNGDNLTGQEIEDLDKDLQDYETNKEVTGLININKRIRLFCGDNSGISISRADIGGLKVSITISIKK